MMSADRSLPAGGIVVGVDGSEPSARAVSWATGQARLEHRPLLLVHAIDPNGAGWITEPNYDYARMVEAMTAWGLEILAGARTAIQELDPSLEIRSEVMLTDPRQALLDLSRDAAMVVLGSRGRGPISSLLLGSVSVAVSQNAGCPVVVLRPKELETETNAIVVGVDGTPRSQNAIEFAFRQASLRSVPLVVSHGFWDTTLDRESWGPVDQQAPEFETQRLLVAESVAGMAEKFPDVEVTYELARGLADDCMIRASRGRGMVVVGSHPTNAILGLAFGEVSRAVTEHADCAVAVVPEN